MNTALAHHAITMLSLCYIPGLLAAYLQLIRGTKYSRFPNWLDKWLRMRKQIGLLMLFSASLHVNCDHIKLFQSVTKLCSNDVCIKVQRNVKIETYIYDLGL